MHFPGGKDGQTALHMASLSPAGEKCAQLLILSGASVTAKDRNGDLALHRAAACGSVAIMRMLLEESVDFSTQNSRGETVLHSAVGGCHYEATELLLKFIELRRGRTAVAETINTGDKVGKLVFFYKKLFFTKNFLFSVP